MIIRLPEQYDVAITKKDGKKPTQIETIVGINKLMDGLKKLELWEELKANNYADDYKIDEYKYICHRYMEPCNYHMFEVQSHELLTSMDITAIISGQGLGTKLLNHRMNLWQYKNTVIMEL